MGRLPALIALCVSLLLGSSVGACGAGGRTARPAASRERPPSGAPSAPRSPLVLHGRTLILPALPLSDARATVLRNPGRWSLSFDLSLRPGAVLTVRFGARPVSFRRGGRRHVEAAAGELWIDGRSRRLPTGGGAISFALRGAGAVRNLVTGDGADPRVLLVQRLAELHARLGAAGSPLGATRHDHLRLHPGYWTSGFWPGALWEAAALESSSMLRGWALAATLPQLGMERSPSHDVGFRYEESSLSAWQALCAPAPVPASAPTPAPAPRGSSPAPGTREPRALCTRLRGSVIAAADELLALAAGNRAAGTIPTGAGGPSADTIIDSMMNILLLPWASRMTGDPAYRRLAERHAHRVAALLVRRDGSTAQAVRFDRASGRVLAIGTHQGLSATSTWSRGQGWAVYGFAQAGLLLDDHSLLRVAVRTAGYVARHLPAGGVPRWDYDAPPGAPVDVSAGVITAAGLLHLATACARLPGICQPGEWRRLGSRMLAAALRHASPRPPLGLLDDQVLNERGGPGCWCNQGELIFGLTYALEGLRLEGPPPGARALHR